MTLYFARFGSRVNGGKTQTRIYRKLVNRQALVDAVEKDETLVVLATWTEETED